MKSKAILNILFFLTAVGRPQSLDPKQLYEPLANSWPTYSGDYSGRRYSALNQINQSNVKNLSLAWVNFLPADSGGPGTTVPTFVGGETDVPVQISGGGAFKVVGSVLEINGILYITAPDHAWAVDAADGKTLWHYFWKTRGGTHIGNRGMAMYHDHLYFETPDNYLVMLDAKTGKEIWHKVIADLEKQYFSTVAPIIVDGHLLIATGNDTEEPGFIRSLDPETGETQWTWWVTPQKKGDPGSDTWPNEDAMRHGGGNPWIPGVFDPETRLYIFGTGNPNPIFSAASREGSNLYTCSIVAVNVDTGKMAWYFQTSPHDTHDYDASQTPILIDGEFRGKPRKLILNANRSGYFFVLDRITGEHLLTTAFSESANWASSINDSGQPVRDTKKDAQIGGALVSPSNPGITNWPPAAFDPKTGLMFVQTVDSYSIFYLTDPDPKEAQGFGGAQEMGLGATGRYLRAIDYKTGKVAWQVKYPMAGGFRDRLPGLLTTAGGLLFGGDASGNLVARNPTTGSPLWHSQLGQITNAPQTYTLGARQYVLVASGATLFAFTIN